MSDQEKKFHQYFSTRAKISISMADGRKLSFVGGTYVTDKEDEIEFLDAQIKAGVSMLYVKIGAEVVTKEQLDPLAAIKKKAIEEHEAKQKALLGSVGMISSAGATTAAASNTKK
jgi:hypothetical protein